MAIGSRAWQSRVFGETRHMAEIHFTYLNGPDIAALAMTDQETLDAV